MNALSDELRRLLERTVESAREVAETGARAALQALAVHHHEPYPSMTVEERTLRNRLRAHGRRLGDRRDARRGAQEIDRLAHECAYEHWHRMLFARFLAENGLLVEPASSVTVTLAECEELARERGEDVWALAGGFAQRMLPQVFPLADPVLQVTLSPETRQALERLLAQLPAAIFTADDALGWTYQYWRSAEKKRVNDRVNSGEKVDGRMLPALTQLFTDHYMVLFLLHNTIGAWYAGRVLAEHPDLLRGAATEDELRDALALDGYEFEYLRFVRVPVGDKGDTAGGSDPGSWQPAAGTFPAWPRRARDLRVLDPCCGSGHFLVAAFDLLVRLRVAEEGLATEEAIRAVLADNLFGLELDPRCTQIAAFNLALAAWKMAGRVIPLPQLNVACVGLAPGASKREWLALAGSDERLVVGMERLYDLFQQAPELGSLIDPHSILGAGKVWSIELGQLQPLLQEALHREEDTSNEERWEIGVAAQGMAKAAEILGGSYHLVITNVPYLKRGKQNDALKEFSARCHSAAKNDLATVFLERCLAFCGEGGTAAIVLPQNWLFLSTYERLREKLLKSSAWHLLARLGAGAFETVTGEVVKAVLLGISRVRKRDGAVSERNVFAALDVSELPRPTEKAEALCNGSIRLLTQAAMLCNPDARIAVLDRDRSSPLSKYAVVAEGLHTGDYYHFGRYFWELPRLLNGWQLQEAAAVEGTHLGGHEHVIYWGVGAEGLVTFVQGRLGGLSTSMWIKGSSVWGQRGVAVSSVGELRATLYWGHVFTHGAIVIVPHDPRHLHAIWAFATSPEFCREVRKLDKKVSVAIRAVKDVPFNFPRWEEVAKRTDGPFDVVCRDVTQWIFHGHPAPSDHPLQVGVARLLGYRWPAELDAEMELSDEARAWVARCSDLLAYADEDGIVCLPAVRGEPPAADRLRALLAAAFGRDWSPAKERQLLQEAAGGGGREAATLDEWLRDRFFEEHCQLFHHRPFVWHIWDGRRDGFHALVNYHRLAGADGEGRRTLQTLTFTYLNDWIDRQRAEQREGKAGADDRLAAALDLQEQLQHILEGEPPYDIFVRWKPLHRQPIGWEPDIDDGVRINMRPFLAASLRSGGRAGAGILRSKPNVDWRKDRGKEPESLRPKADYPWFWGCDPDRQPAHRIDFLGGSAFDGKRWNDLHYRNAVRQAAREALAREAAS
jgi:hypothetical protein